MFDCVVFVTGEKKFIAKQQLNETWKETLWISSMPRVKHMTCAWHGIMGKQQHQAHDTLLWMKQSIWYAMDRTMNCIIVTEKKTENRINNIELTAKKNESDMTLQWSKSSKNLFEKPCNQLSQPQNVKTSKDAPVWKSPFVGWFGYVMFFFFPFRRSFFSSSWGSLFSSVLCERRASIKAHFSTHYDTINKTTIFFSINAIEKYIARE